MKTFTIRDWRTGEIIHQGEEESFKEFVEKNKGNLKSAYLEDANLNNANLECANFKDANLECADLNGANLKDANLFGANLVKADLFFANFNDANLKGANLVRANLECANFKDANLECADLNGANLKDANLKDSIISIYSKRSFSMKLLDPNIEKQDIQKIKIIIGCKTKTISEWDEWFASDEKYETKRGTFEFRQIEAMYEAYKAYVVKLWS